MTILGIETSHTLCSVGVLNDGNIIERSLKEPRAHSEQLLALIAELCDVQKLTAVAISIGPGSFTGLRIGLSAAKGLCYSIGIPLLAVQTFHSIAQSTYTRYKKNTVGICIDAKQGEMYTGIIQVTETNEFIDKSTLTIEPAEEVFTKLKESDIVVTDSDYVKEQFQTKNILCIDVAEVISGTAVAVIGSQLYKNQQYANLSNIEPYYLKDFVVKKHSQEQTTERGG